MKQQISVKIINGKTKEKIYSDTNRIEFSDKTTVAEIIPQIKSLIKRPLNIESEKFYCGNDELKLTDIVPNTTGNELEIIVK